MKKAGLLFIAITFTALSCTSDDVPVIEAQGVVRNTGDIAADGCGWVIEINGTQYSPTYLNSDYEQDGLRVFLNVEFLSTRFSCGLGAGLDQIRIEQIKPSSN